MPFWYYDLLRILIFVASIYFAIQYNRRRGIVVFTILFSISAIVYNPIMPIYLYDKGQWMLINLFTLFLFVFGAYSLKQTDSIIKETKTYFDRISNRIEHIRQRRTTIDQDEVMHYVRDMCRDGIDFQLIHSALDMRIYQERDTGGLPILPEYSLDPYFSGYIFGFHDALHKSVPTKIDDMTYMASCAVIFDRYFGNEGQSILRRSQDFETADEDDTIAESFKDGCREGAEDALAAKVSKKIPGSLLKHLASIRPYGAM